MRSSGDNLSLGRLKFKVQQGQVQILFHVAPDSLVFLSVNCLDDLQWLGQPQSRAYPKLLIEAEIGVYIWGCPR